MVTKASQRGDEPKANLNFIWDNTHYVIGDKIVELEDSLGMGLKVSLILTELTTRDWERGKIETKKRIRKCLRYLENSIGFWRGNEEKLKDEIKKMEVIT